MIFVAKDVGEDGEFSVVLPIHSYGCHYLGTSDGPIDLSNGPIEVVGPENPGDPFFINEVEAGLFLDAEGRPVFVDVVGVDGELPFL